MKHDDGKQGNGREPVSDRDQEVSDLVVRVNEPDVYTPTLDLSDDPSQKASQELLRQAATRPGVRRAIREKADHQLELVPTDETAALQELQNEIERYKLQTRSTLTWLWGLVAAVVAAMIVAFLGSRK